jgi:hypothetical protein
VAQAWITLAQENNTPAFEHQAECQAKKHLTVTRHRGGYKKEA